VSRKLGERARAAGRRRGAASHAVRARGARPGWLAAVLIVLAAVGAWTATAAAGEIQFSASVDRTSVGVGEQFQLVLTVQGEDMLSVPSPELPAMADISVLGRSSSQSTSISLMNGQLKKQATMSFIYVLAARKVGPTTIPACRLRYQGHDYQSQPIEISVAQAPQGQATPLPAAPGAPPASEQVPLEGNLYLSVIPSRRTAYVGEPLAVEIALVTRFQISDGGWAALPQFDGFWVEKVFDADRLAFERRTIGGRAYGVGVLKKVVLFPLTPGDATIKPMAFTVAVTQPSRDFFDMFGRTQTLRVESKPIALKILPLPEKDKPKDFTGGVGQFTLLASLDRTSSSNGEPVNLVVKVTGSGNLHMLDPPAVPPIPGLKILVPESKEDTRVEGDVVRGTRTFRYPILPQGDGKFAVGPVDLAYFDPKAHAYRTLRAGPLEFSASGSATSAPIAEASGLKVLGTDINYIKPDAASLGRVPMDPPWWPNLLYVFSLALVGSALGIRTHRDRLETDRGYARKARSSGLVRSRLQQAERQLRKGDMREFHAELSRALLGYVGDRFNLDTHALTRDQLRAEMERAGIPTDTVSAALDVLDRCEMARFAPGAGESRDARALFEAARAVMGRL